MINLKIEMDQKAYPLYIGVDILPKLSEIYQLYGYSNQAVLVSEERLKDSYGDFLCREFSKKNIELVPIFLPAQQIEKGFHSIPSLTSRLLESGLKPKDILISMGGSRLLHFTSFLASIIYGGVPTLQIPTTLTAQVVKSVDLVNRIPFGSKPDLFCLTGHPILVWSDLAFLKTLPENNFISGLGNIFRYACLLKNGLFEFLENYVDEVVKKDLDRLEESVQRSCDTKIVLFKNQGSDKNYRSRMRFGDTTAHELIEVARPSIRYGEALFFGMLVEAVISFKLGIFSGPDFERFYELLKRFPLKYLLSRVNGDKLLQAVETKLKSQKAHTLTLPQQIGEFVYNSPVQFSDYEYAINIIFSD